MRILRKTRPCSEQRKLCLFRPLTCPKPANAADKAKNNAADTRPEKVPKSLFKRICRPVIFEYAPRGNPPAPFRKKMFF